jgi:uncharacterized protein (DUF433 family)
MNYVINQAAILNALREGASAEEIAHDFNEALNNAVDAFAKERMKQGRKLEAARAALDFYTEYYPKLVNDMTAEDFIASCDRSAKSSVENPLYRLYNL